MIVTNINPKPNAIYIKDENNFIIGWGVENSFRLNQNNLDGIQAFIDQYQGQYIFTQLSYDLKNLIFDKLEDYSINNENFKLANLIVPEHIVIVKNGAPFYFGHEENINWINNLTKKESEIQNLNRNVQLAAEYEYKEYEKRFNIIKSHLQRGDIYEVNYCVNQSSKFIDLNTIGIFKKNFETSKAPFSVYFNLEEFAVISGSPERFIAKNSSSLISQPIKGTAKRGKTKLEDDELALTLKNDAKERSENIMIVDLVRNDISKIALPGTVNVKSLCEVMAFKTVHQLVSTISAKIKSESKFTDIIKAMFPMGSMTGAPKLRAMQIIDNIETFQRGPYAGTIGFIEPNGNFDFNVVIRSILVDKINYIVNAPVGGAITINANPLKEYEECLLKLKSMESTLCWNNSQN